MTQTPPDSSRPSSPDPGAPRRTGPLAVAALLLVALGAVLFFWLGRRAPEPETTVAKAKPSAPATKRRAAPPPWASDPDAPRGTIDGRVLDPDGKPVAGAIVAAVPEVDLAEREEADEVRPAAVAESGKDGRYQLTDVRPGPYAVTATAPGFLGGRHPDVLLPPGESLHGIDVTLAKGGVILSGTVSDTGGGPIAHAEVRALLTDGRTDVSRMVVTRAGNDGRYEVALLPGQYSLSADADGYARDATWMRIDGNTTKDFRLNPAAVVAGRVIVRGAGTPVDGATVSVSSEDLWFDSREARTDKDGKFEFKNLDPGSYSFGARKGALVGVAGKAVDVTLAARVDDVVVEVDTGRTIAGHVRATTAGAGGAGAPVGGARVRLGQQLWAGGGLGATAAADGSYRIEGILPGRYNARASADGHAAAHRPVAVAEVDLTDVDFALPPESVVTGVVQIADGTPVKGARVSAVVQAGNAPFGQDSSFGSAETGADGKFRIDGLGAGKLVVSAEHSEQGRGHLANLSLGAGETKDVTVTLESGAFITGTVRWDDGQPAAAVSVRGFAVGTGMMGMMPPTTRTGADGTYRLGPFPKGTVMVNAQRKEGGMMFMMGPGARRDRVSVEIGANDDVKSGVDLTLDKGGLEIAGTVVDADGKPMGGATVGATPEIMGRNARAFGRMPAFGDNKIVTGDDGTFTISDLNKGNYTVWAQAPGLAEAQVHPVAAGAKGVRVAFKKPATLAGVAVYGSGKPVTDYSLLVTLADGAAKTDEQRMAARFGASAAEAQVHDPGGAFEVKGLAEGTYDLVLTTADSKAGRLASITVGAGEDKRGLKITVSDGATIKGRVVDLDSGQPMAGVSVRSMSGGAMTFGPGMDDGVTTDAQGQFKLSGIVPGKRTVLLAMGDMQNYAPESRAVTVPEGKTEADVGTIKLLKSAGGMGARMAPDYGSPGMMVGPGDNGGAIVEGLRPETPAAKAGVKVGEPITKVGGRDAKDMGPNAVSTLLGGKIGTSVEVEVGGRAMTLERVAGR